MVAKPQVENETGRTRTTLTLDNDVLVLIRRRAAVTGESMGKVVSELIRVAQGSDEEELPPYVIPRRMNAPMVTMELVNRLRDELP
jgi:hypothetical protein